MTRIAIIAALPGELAPFVRGQAREVRGARVLWRGRRGDREWIAACGGIGREAAGRAFAEAEKDGPLGGVVSAGWAGALREGFIPGKTYRVSIVVDARTGEAFRAAGGGCRLVTADRVADAPEKRRLAAAHQGDLVDMEAAEVARLTAARGLPFRCVKGVSDGADERLPDFSPFLGADGQLRTGRLALFALLRPWLWRRLARLGANSRKAAEAMREALAGAVDDLA